MLYIDVVTTGYVGAVCTLLLIAVVTRSNNVVTLVLCVEPGAMAGTPVGAHELFPTCVEIIPGEVTVIVNPEIASELAVAIVLSPSGVKDMLNVVDPFVAVI